MPSWDVSLIYVRYRREGPGEGPGIPLYRRAPAGGALGVRSAGGCDMPPWDVRLTSVGSRRDGPAEEPVIQLYGRTREGRSLAAEHRGVQPYFYVRNMPQSLRGAFEHDPGVVRQEDVSLLVAAKPTPCVKVTLRHPWRTPDYRNKAKGYGCEVLAADIPFAHRFVYDKDLAACVTIQGRESDLGGRYTTELRVEAEGFAPCEPFNPTLKILSFDIENNWRGGATHFPAG